MQGNKENRVFVLRYNDNYIKDTMLYHKEICDSVGYCWYGKVGKKPNMLKLNEFIEEGTAKIMFYNKKKSYMGNLLKVSEKMPEQGYPNYYKETMWEPNSWYLVSELKEIPEDILKDLIVLSTKKSLSETINSSMTSFYFTKLIS